jgi:hypothetical protein
LLDFRAEIDPYLGEVFVYTTTTLFKDNGNSKKFKLPCQSGKDLINSESNFKGIFKRTSKPNYSTQGMGTF